MTDDIVTRLRQEWEYGNNAKGCDYEMFAEAADEIERLRTLADNLAHELQGYVCHCNMSKCRCGYDEVMNEYYEVRGE